MDVEISAPLEAFDLDDSCEETLAAPPTVVAVMVTHNAGPWFEATLESFANQDYPGLTVLVLDAGSDEDPTARVAQVLPTAFVRRIDEPGFGRAANEVMTTVEGANFLCFAHDDVVLEPNAIRTMVEEAFRSNAAIVGPKIVDAEEPRLLREVGWAIDRFGEPHSYVEPGEFDQEQHDAVRDVFFVSNVTMLVRADLFQELDGFDVDAFPGAEDLDLCWRARLLGARVMVVPDARVAHREAADDRPGVESPNLKAIERHRVRAFAKNSSTFSLLVWAPIAMAMTAVEAFALLFTKQRTSARASMAAWWGQMLHLGSIRKERKRVQSSRVVDDAELHYLRVGGSARLRQSVRKHLFGDATVARLDEAREQAADVRNVLRRPIAILGALIVALFMIGSRDIVLGHLRSVGSFVPWNGVGPLFGVFFGGWRGSGMGAPTFASPAFAAAGTISTALFGADSLARTVVVLGAVPLGAWGVARCVRTLVGREGIASFVAAAAYLVSPVWRNAIAQGRLGAVVAYACVPLVVAALLRAGELEDAALRRRVRARAVLLLAVATACAPVSVVLVALAVAGCSLAVPFVGGGDLTRALLRNAGVVISGALLLAAGWFVGMLLVGVTPQALGLAFRPSSDVVAVMKWSTGPAGSGWLAWGLLVAALAPLVAAGSDRFAWAVRGTFWYLLAVLAAWAPSLVSRSVVWFAPETLGVLGALGLAVSAAMGAAALRHDLPQTRFGLRHVVTIAGLAAVALASLGFVADAGSGRWSQPADDWSSQLGWTQSAARRGEGRVLWLGDAQVLPLDSIGRSAGTDYALTDNGPAGVVTLLPAPGGGAEARLERALARVADGRTIDGSRTFADLGIRYVVVVERPAPNAGPTVVLPGALRSGLDAQLGLAPQQSGDGAVVYENADWVPVAATRTADGQFVPTGNGRTTPAGLVTQASNRDAAWNASVNGVELRGRSSTRGNAWNAPVAGKLTLSYGRNWLGVVVGAVTLAAWIVVAVAALGWRPRRRQRVVELLADEIDLREPESVR
ncbi:MAG: glycosyltransferase family 2 protein [Acidimicrobiia bacterium]